MKRREDTKIKKMKAEKRRAKVKTNSIKNNLSVFSSAQSLPKLCLFLLFFVGSA